MFAFVYAELPGQPRLLAYRKGVKMATFEMYYSYGQYRWRLRDSNHKIIADSAEGYSSKYNVQRAIGNVKHEVPGARVVDNT